MGFYVLEKHSYRVEFVYKFKRQSDVTEFHSIVLGTESNIGYLLVTVVYGIWIIYNPSWTPPFNALTISYE